MATQEEIENIFKELGLSDNNNLDLKNENFSDSKDKRSNVAITWNFLPTIED